MKTVLLLVAIIALIQLVHCSNPPACDGKGRYPVCGENGVRFFNSCWLDLYNYCSKNDVNPTTANCPATGGCACTRLCPNEDKPICAYESSTGMMKTYRNPCEFSCAAKCSDKEVDFVSCGPCGYGSSCTNANCLDGVNLN